MIKLVISLSKTWFSTNCSGGIDFFFDILIKHTTLEC